MIVFEAADAAVTVLSAIQAVYQASLIVLLTAAAFAVVAAAACAMRQPRPRRRARPHDHPTTQPNRKINKETDTHV